MNILVQNNIKAAIFDMDGVLFDTEKLYERFWIEAARISGFDMTKDDVSSIRSTDQNTAQRIIKGRLGDAFDYISIRKLRQKLMADYIDNVGIEVKPGVRSTLELLRVNNIKIGLATTSNEKRAKHYLKLGGIYDYFDAVISSDMISRGKPDPMIYLTAAMALNTDTKECIAFEDSYNGVRSAYGAGCHVVMVIDRDMPDAEMREKTEAVTESFDEFLRKYI